MISILDKIKEIQENKPQNKALKSVLSKTVGKLKKDKILCFSIKANDENCKFAGNCKNFCYAKKSFYKMPSVKNAYDYNKNASLQSDFVNRVTTELKYTNWEFIRIHSSGDFYSREYLNKWIEIAIKNPEKIFYAYTKAIVYFKNITLPKNFLMIQSEGTINDKKYLDYSKPFARVFTCKKEFNKAIKSGKFLDSTESDLNTVKAILKGLNVALFLH